VARGALLRHTTTTLLPPYLGWSLALVRNEDYDRNLHPDGRMDQKRRKAGSKRKTIKLSWNPAVVKKDDIDGNDVVEDRLNWIVVSVLPLSSQYPRLTSLEWQNQNCQGQLVRQKPQMDQ